MVNNGNQTTLADTGEYGDFAVTISGPSQVAVALYANFYSATDVQQPNTLLHELLHAVGYSHTGLVDQYKSFGLQGDFDISAWLERDCRPKK